MAPVQTTYTTTHAAGAEGAVVDAQLANVQSKSAEEAIPFGRFVTRGTGAEQCKLPTSGLEVAQSIGVAIRVQDDVANASDVLQYEVNRGVSILDFGVVYMRPEDAVTAGDPVFVRHVAAGAEELGSVRSDTEGTDATAVGGCQFMDDAAAGELVRVRVRMTN